LVPGVTRDDRRRPVRADTFSSREGADHAWAAKSCLHRQRQAGTRDIGPGVVRAQRRLKFDLLLTMRCLQQLVATTATAFVDFPVSPGDRFGTGCHRLRPQGSIKAPSSRARRRVRLSRIRSRPAALHGSSPLPTGGREPERVLDARHLGAIAFACPPRWATLATAVSVRIGL
jgi:hypothetical protein